MWIHKSPTNDGKTGFKILMIDHVTISVSDLAKSKVFYEKILTPFLYQIVFGEESRFWAFDIGNGALFEIAQYKADNKITSCHVAFRAKNREQVQQFYKAAIAAGGTCNGEPDLRPLYTATYYAAFILDPDGHSCDRAFIYPIICL